MAKIDKYTILVIDDEPNNTIALTEILETEHTVCAVIDSLRALETAERDMPDVILLDILMPGMDGYEVISALKNSKKTQDIPVIFITGLDGIEAEEKGFTLGAADYISKPFHFAIVKTRVRNQIRLIERHRQQALMTKIAHSFLSDASTDSLLTDTLRMVGEFMDISQLLLYKLDDDVLTCQSEWINPALNLESRIGESFELSEPIITIINNLLTSRESDLCLHSNGTYFREALNPHRKNFQSFITTPIFIKGGICAVIDFSRDDGQDWDKNEINLAVLVSDILSGVFERDAMESQFSIVENSPDSVLSITSDASVVYVNPVASDVFGYTKREFYTNGLDAIFGNKIMTAIINHHIPYAMRGKTAHFEADITRKNGEKGITSVSIFQMKQKNFGMIIRDLTEIRELKIKKEVLEKENEKIFFDGLTNIYNRRFFDETIPKIIKSLSRSNSTLSLVMIDIDFFKQYNDTYGHGAGDDCLKTVADTLSQNIPRADDFVARYGGEEFVIVLPNTDETGARNVAERLLRSIQACDIPHKSSSAANHVSISIGIATGMAKHTHKADDFIKHADMMLYKSKQDGRNRYSLENL